MCIDLGEFGFFNSFMSQPKSQLSTFKSWAGLIVYYFNLLLITRIYIYICNPAGTSSDISYYLNSHHIDIHEWAVSEFARPIHVTVIYFIIICGCE